MTLYLLQDLLTILPMMDPLVLLDVTGDQLCQALENGVSQWPKLEGRFPQVSGITFAFDPSQPSGSRVDPNYVKIGDEYVDKYQHYKLVTKVVVVSSEHYCEGQQSNSIPGLSRAWQRWI